MTDSHSWLTVVLDYLQMGDDGDEGSSEDGYHNLTLHTVASSTGHHTGNPFAAGNTPRNSAGESSSLLASSSGLPPLSPACSATTPRTRTPVGKLNER